MAADFISSPQEQTVQKSSIPVSRRSLLQAAAALGGTGLAGSLPGIVMAQGTAPTRRC
jgi:hypothetical protein